MSKSAPQAPPPPNPALVAQQQSGSDIDTAVAQKALNNTNQYTPFGSTTYQQTGSQSIGGVDVPTYSQTTSFNPAVQSIISGTENAGASLVPAVQTSQWSDRNGNCCDHRATHVAQTNVETLRIAGRARARNTQIMSRIPQDRAVTLDFPVLLGEVVKVDPAVREAATRAATAEARKEPWNSTSR
jgi:hypothetical protein